MRKLQNYIDKYGEEAGRKLFHLLQSHAAHAGVSARRKRKIDEILSRRARPLPLFPEATLVGVEAAEQP